jgi:hypothetical protein
MLQEGKINGSQEKKIKTITELLIIIVETKQNKIGKTEYK